MDMYMPESIVVCYCYYNSNNNNNNSNHRNNNNYHYYLFFEYPLVINRGNCKYTLFQWKEWDHHPSIGDFRAHLREVQRRCA